MMDCLGTTGQTLLFIGLVILWVRLAWQFGKWLYAAITDDGMM